MDLTDAFRASLTSGQLNAYLSAVKDFDTAALAAAVARFRKGDVPWFTSTYPPVAPEFAREVALHHRNLHREDNILALKAPEHGMIDADYGSGKVRLADLTWAEVQIVEKHNGKTPEGRDLAGLTTEEIREALTQPMLPMSAPRARLQRMGK